MPRKLSPLLIKRGLVIQGKHDAQKTGYPTANISFKPCFTSGTYAGKVLVGKEEYNATVYVDQKRHIIEAYLFDFQGDLYRRYITVILLTRIRETTAFHNVRDEKKYIKDAINQVKKYLDTNPYVHRHYSRKSPHS